MQELTLESLAPRVAELDRKLASINPAKRDWRSIVGISEEKEFARQMQAEIETNSDAVRRTAVEEDAP